MTSVSRNKHISELLFVLPLNCFVHVDVFDGGFIWLNKGLICFFFRCVRQLHPAAAEQSEAAGGGKPAADVTGKFPC